MNTKCIGGGRTLDYMKSKKNKMGMEREQVPEKLLGNPELVRALLGLQAAPVVREEDRPRRETAHLRRHLTHLMNCYSERQAVVEPKLKRICLHTQDLLLAGLPRQSLAFVWYKHGQAIGTHAHGALVHSVLSGGGPYEPNLRAALLQRSDRLVSRALGLSDPLDPARALLALACWASWKDENIDLVKEVITRTQGLWHAREIRRHSDFEEKVLQQLGFEVLVSPRQDGQPEVRLEFCHEPRLPKYPNCVTARKGDRTIVFRGPVCRPGFNAARHKTSLERRQRKVDELRQSPLPLFEEFLQLLKERLVFQQNYYGLGDSQDSVKKADFEWLLSPPAPKVDPQDTPEKELERVIGFPEAFYPYSGDDQEITWSVADPRIATEKVERDPLLAKMESDQEVIWPREWLPQDEAQRQEQAKQQPQPWFEFESDGGGLRKSASLSIRSPSAADSPADQPKSILGRLFGRLGRGHSSRPAHEGNVPVPTSTPTPVQPSQRYKLGRLLDKRLRKRTPRQQRAQLTLLATQERGRALQSLAPEPVIPELASARPQSENAPPRHEKPIPSASETPKPAGNENSKPSQPEVPKPEDSPGNPNPPPQPDDNGIS